MKGAAVSSGKLSNDYGMTFKEHIPGATAA